ncbi:MAG: hypothetical protein V7785_12940 [Bermanella sp.]
MIKPVILLAFLFLFNGHVFAYDQKFWEDMSSRNSITAYQLYLSNFPNGLHAEEARSAIEKKYPSKTKAELEEEKRLAKAKLEEEKRLAKAKVKADKAAEIANINAEKKRKADLIASQACVLHDNKWLYLSKSCSGKYAHGEGKAQTESGLTFIGLFKNGYRVKGEVLLNGSLKYDGNIKNGRPHGEGVCIHNGEPEACKFYKGKRIDGLYKQRIEFAIQSEKLEKQQQEIVKQQNKILATQNKQNRMLETQRKLATERAGSSQPVQYKHSTETNTAPNPLESALKRKAADKAADFIFDQLF